MISLMCLTQHGTLSKHRRKQYKYSVQKEVFGYIEEITQRLLGDQEEEMQ